jgi:hypothetical protein
LQSSVPKACFSTFQTLKDAKTFSLRPFAGTGVNPIGDVVKRLLDFLYDRQISIPPENVIAVFPYGEILQVPALAELGTDTDICVEVAGSIPANCLRLGHGADFLFCFDGSIRRGVIKATLRQALLQLASGLHSGQIFEQEPSRRSNP